jgi:hypothetical protein
VISSKNSCHNLKIKTDSILALSKKYNIKIYKSRYKLIRFKVKLITYIITF